MVFVVRNGNPKNIETWDDLVKPGVEIVTPNPASSGSARWNILAAYGSVIADGGTEEDAAEYMTKFFNNVVALPEQRPRRHHRLPGGTGDVLLSYENEAILARQNGEDFDYVVPDDHAPDREPGRASPRTPPSGRRTSWTSSLSDEGQKQYAATGFRPVVTTSTTSRSRARTTRPTRSPSRRRC